MNAALQAAPFAVFLFILPFPGTVSLRLLCLALAFVLALVSARRWSPPPLPCKAVLLFWALVAAAAVAYSFDVRYSLGEFKNEVIYALMAFWAFFVFSRGTRELAVGLVPLAAAAALIVLWGTAGTIAEGAWVEGRGHGGEGSVSTFLLSVTPLFAIALFATPDKRARWLLYALLVLVVIGAIATRQRIIWPIFAVQFAIGAVLLRRTGLLRFGWRSGALVMGAVLVCAAALVIGLQQWREQSNRVRPVSVDARWAVWPKALQRIADQPLKGVGLGRQAMRKVHPEWVPDEDRLVWHAHNMFLNAGISMGVPGVLALLLVFGGLFAAYANLLGSAEAVARLAGIAGILMLVGVLGRNMTNDFFVRDGALLFWALNGALLGAGIRLDARTAKA